MMRFQDRRDAGRQLAKRLLRYVARPDVTVLGVHRDGIPVAYEVARTLGAPLEVVVDGRVGSHLSAPGRDSTVILVDESLTSEDRILRAVGAVRALGDARVVVAAPVGAADVCARLRCLADDCVVALAPFPLRNPGEWFQDHEPASDSELEEICAKADADVELALHPFG